MFRKEPLLLGLIEIGNEKVEPDFADQIRFLALHPLTQQRNVLARRMPRRPGNPHRMNAVASQTVVALTRRFCLCKVIDMTRKVDDCLHAIGARLRDDFVSISVEFWCVEMTVAVDPH